MARSNVLEAKNLVKSYGSSRVLDGLSLSVGKGECLGIIGPNGAGKTTAIRICLGLLAADSGDVNFLGFSLPEQGREARSRMGVVAQFDTLDPDFSCVENLRVYARYFGIPRAEIHSRIPKLLAFSELTQKANSKITQLSGGMQRRLSLARALVNDPDLLVLDEPTTGLDPQARRLIWERLGLLTEQGKSILLTTHFMEEASMLCDRVLVMDHGQKLAEDTPQNLVNQFDATDLEDVFLKLTGQGLRDDAEI
jgi:lipooligosaccharide transport system ATP-binding protein